MFLIRGGGSAVLMILSPVDPIHTVHGALSANTFAIYGTGQNKELTELVPGILNQLGPDSLASLRKLAESYQAIQQQGAGRGGAGGAAGGGDDDDDDVPDLVESFDVPDVPAGEKKEEEKAEEKKVALEEMD
jgi:nascent polypeptide-associated complex subunit beta